MNTNKRLPEFRRPLRPRSCARTAGLSGLRIGQNRRVVVHRLITKDTFEEKINDILESKKKISEMTVATGENWITKMSDDELREVFTLGKN